MGIGDGFVYQDRIIKDAEHPIEMHEKELFSQIVEQFHFFFYPGSYLICFGNCF
jgi:hypothetical protein